MRLNLANIVLALASAGLYALAWFGWRDIQPAVRDHRTRDTAYVANAGELTGWRLRREHQGNNGNAGGVSCHNTKPHLESYDSTAQGRERDENLLHEQMHGRQFAVGCDSIMGLWNTVPAFRLELEAQATCYGLQVYTDSLYRYRKGLAATRISAAYGNVVAFEDVYSALERWCP